MAPTVSVVICTYQRRASLSACLRPLLADADADEIVVVDDGGSDGSYELVRDLARSDTRLRAVWIVNGGKEQARQRGVEEATSEVVVLLDDDVVAEPGLIGGHARHHARENGLVVLGYMPVADGRLASPASRIYAREYEARTRHYDEEPHAILDRLWGGNVSLRRADALRVGLRSPGFRAGYHQDRDFGLRCREAGLRGRFDRTLAAKHHHSRDIAGFVRDCDAQGRAHRQLHGRHRSTLGLLASDAFAADLPRGLRVLVGFSRRDRAGTVVVGGLRHLARALTAVRATRAAELALRVLRRVAQQRGALAEHRQEHAALVTDRPEVPDRPQPGGAPSAEPAASG